MVSCCLSKSAIVGRGSAGAGGAAPAGAGSKADGTENASDDDDGGAKGWAGVDGSVAARAIRGGRMPADWSSIGRPSVASSLILGGDWISGVEPGAYPDSSQRDCPNGDTETAEIGATGADVVDLLVFIVERRRKSGLGFF
ncbi:hypothetical protein Plhal304r1_c015g0056861 [Plasmopara halstedii]